MSGEVVDVLDLELKIRVRVRGDDGKLQIAEIPYRRTFSDGSASNDQVGQVFYDASRTLNNTSEDLDVNGSALKDFKGDGLDMTSLRMVLVENLATESGDTVAVKQPAANGVPNIFLAAGDGVKVPPRGLFLWVGPGPDDATVTPSSGDLVTVTTNDNIDYRVLLAGKNA